MSFLRKIGSALRLAARLDQAKLRGQLHHNLARARVRWHRHQPFAFGDLGFPFVCHPDWPDSLDFFCAHRALATENWELSLVQRWLEPGDTMIDAGANLGIYTFAGAKAVGETGCVISIDADDYIVRKIALSARLLRQPQVAARHAALTSQTGTITFYVQSGRNDTTLQSLRPQSDSAQLTSVTVPAVTLDDLVREHRTARRPSLVKIDIEGAENDALSAAPPEWFGPDGPLWILELNPDALARFGATIDDILQRLPSRSFDRWLLAKCPQADRPTRLSSSARGSEISGSLYYNLVAIPCGDRWEQSRARIKGAFPSEASASRILS